MSFRKWLESQTLGGGLHPPKQRPELLGKGAHGSYSAPGSEKLPPTRKRMKAEAGMCKCKMCKAKAKKMCKCKMCQK